MNPWPLASALTEVERLRALYESQLDHWRDLQHAGVTSSELGLAASDLSTTSRLLKRARDIEAEQLRALRGQVRTEGAL